MTEKQQEELVIKILKADKIYYVSEYTGEVQCSDYNNAITRKDNEYYLLIGFYKEFSFDMVGITWAFDKETLTNNVNAREIKRLQKVIERANKQIKELEEKA